MTTRDIPILAARDIPVATGNIPMAIGYKGYPNGRPCGARGRALAHSQVPAEGRWLSVNTTPDGCRMQLQLLRGVPASWQAMGISEVAIIGDIPAR